MNPTDLLGLVEKFFALVRDHGTFRECQLYEYVSIMTHRKLTQQEKWDLTAVAIGAGAKPQKFDGLVNHHDPRVFRFPVKRRRGLPTRRTDKHTVDMFTRSTSAEEEERKRKQAEEKKAEEEARRGRITARR